MCLQFVDSVENWSLHALSVLDILMFKRLQVVAMVFGGVDGEKKMMEILRIVVLSLERWVDVWIERRGRWKEVGFVRGKGRLKRVVVGWEISGRVVMKKFQMKPYLCFPPLSCRGRGFKPAAAGVPLTWVFPFLRLTCRGRDNMAAATEPSLTLWEVLLDTAAAAELRSLPRYWSKFILVFEIQHVCRGSDIWAVAAESSLSCGFNLWKFVPRQRL